jgi:sec-independent protein translocase protein TatA
MSGSEILLILLAILVLFGADKLPELARGLGKGMREMKKASDEIKREIENQASDVTKEINNIKKDVSENNTPIDEMRKEIENTKDNLKG